MTGRPSTSRPYAVLPGVPYEEYDPDIEHASLLAYKYTENNVNLTDLRETLFEYCMLRRNIRYLRGCNQIIFLFLNKKKFLGMHQ